jgi:uncharacterized delta-60 repeat protein
MKKVYIFLFLAQVFTLHPQKPVIITSRTSSAVLKSLTDTSVNNAGLADKKFGALGLVKQPFVTANVFDLAKGLTLLPDKRIVVTGYTGDPLADGGAGRWKLILLCYLPSGQLDPTFGVGGMVIQQFSTLFYDQVNTVVSQPDGALLVGGETRNGGAGQYKFLLARYTQRGVLDTSYGVNGKVNQPFLGTDSYDEINMLCLQPNNYSIAIGYSKDEGGQKISVARYTSQGVLDSTFGVGGSFLQSFLGDQHLDTGVAGIVCADGTWVVGGTSSDGGVGRIKCVVARYTSTGTLVNSFGTGGIVLQPYVGTGNHDEVTCMAVQTDGAIVVGGFSSDNGGKKALLIRYTSEGVLDSSFGNGGIIKQPFLGAGVTQDTINSLVLQPDGKILVGGATNDGGGNKYFLARYGVGGALDSTFGVGGIVKSPFIGDGAGDELYDVVLSPEGGIIASGYTQDGGGSKLFVTKFINAVDFSYYGSQLGGFYR